LVIRNLAGCWWWLIPRKEILFELSVLASHGRGNGKFMKKASQTKKDELRAEYKRSDFSGPLVRGKYVKWIRESTNIVVLKPEVAKAFPNEEAVNTALLSLIKIAQTTSRRTRSGSERSKASSL